MQPSHELSPRCGAVKSVADVTVNLAHDKRDRKTPTGSVSSMRILVVDDEVDLAEAVARGLRREGYAVDIAHDGASALEKAELVPYDLVCLDVTMPGIDGLEVCERLRDNPPDGDAPRVLMLTARDSIEDRIDGLDHGADDYLVKPFAFGELTARIRSLLRRGRRNLDLTAKEFALLRYFMSHVDEVLSQEHLLEHVWDEHADPFTNTVRVTVGTLRRKLSEDDESQVIETVIGSGYRLIDAGAAPGVDGD